MKEDENTQQQLSESNTPLARLLFTEDIEITSSVGDIGGGEVKCTEKFLFSKILMQVGFRGLMSVQREMIL